MPELPDIEVFSRNLKKLYVGQKLTSIKIVHPKNIKETQAQLTKALRGYTVKNVYRAGKELRLKFSSGNILGIHLMLTGDLIPFEKNNDRKSTKVELYFENGHNLALIDRFRNAFVKLNPEEKAGIDALDRKLSYAYLKKLFHRKAAVKNLLLDQHLIRGIGNGYSDEILWQARISPFSKANAIPDEKVRELARVIKTVLKKAIKDIDQSHPGLIHGEVKEFLQIHTKKRDKSPTGALIKTTSGGFLKTYYTDEQKLYK